MTSASRTHDLILFGASGFVGALTAKHLAEHAPEGARIALAGRSRAKVESVRATLPALAHDWPIVEADASDPEAMRELAESTKVIVTTVGPYARYGLPVVAACAAAGTHYADLTGEVLFVRESADSYHEVAKASGAKITHACGFDSIPSDLGVWLTAEQARADGAGELTQTTLYVRSLRGGFSGGTIDSMRQQAIEMGDPASAKIVNDPYGLSPDRSAEPSSGKRKKAKASGPLDVVKGLVTSAPVRRSADGHWLGPFVMAAFNTRIVRRSNALLGHAYGRGFRYQEVMDFGTSLTSPVMATGFTAGLLGVVGGMRIPATRSLLGYVLPKPGEGPSPEAQKNGRFKMEIDAATTSGARYRTIFGAKADPGYSGTAIMLGEAALSLAFDDLPPMAGVLTPATAIGEALADRLRAQNFTIRTEAVGSAPEPGSASEGSGEEAGSASEGSGEEASSAPNNFGAEASSAPEAS